MDGWMARHGDGCRQDCNEDASNLDYYLCSQGATEAIGNHTLYFQGCRQSFGIEVLEVDAATHIVLIPIIYQSHRAGSIA